MKVFRLWPLIMPMLLLCVRAAYSHHSFSAVYDGTKQTTVSGVVTKFRFVNPHAMMYLDAADASGNVAKWVVEFDGRLNLSNYGWTENSIKSGEQVTVTGNPSHTESNRIFFLKLVHADGTELVRGGQRLNAIEEDRRRRALQRDQQKP
jgi:Family of unknown function (DUF6152)